MFSDWESRVEHVRRVLEKLRQAGLRANPKKCKWGRERMEFSEHVVGEGGVSIPQAHAAAMGLYVKLSTKKGLQSFLEMISYYRKFVKDLAEQTAVLKPATSKAAPPNIQ